MLTKTLVFVMLFGVSLGNVTKETIRETTRYKQSTTEITTEVPNSSEFVTETDFNISTIFNTTTVSSTTPSTLNTTQKPSVARHQDEFSCLCDLHRRACDIGCCCDRDCTYEKKKIFRHCDAVTKTNVDRSACQYYEMNYVNFTVHEWEIQNNDFFCVAKTNLPPSYTVQKEKPFMTYEETRLEKKTGDFWPHVNVESYKDVNFSEPYVQSIPIKLVINDSSLGIFRLSESFFTSGCNIQSEINYLNDFDSHCVHLLKEDNNFLRANFYEDILFVAKPDALNLTILNNKLLTCPTPVCLKPHMKICSDVHLRNCSFTTTDISFHCQKKGEHINCINIVDSLEFTIYHNGVDGIKNVTLFLHLVNVTHRSDIQHYEIPQKISVDFEWASSMLNYSDVLSGNPGYLIGKPILLGTLVNGTIRRDPESFKDNFMVLPYEDFGVCQIGKYSYQPIEFGFNTILFCKIRGSIGLANGSKPADVCRNIQMDVFKYWNIEGSNGSFVNRTYGQFGNAITSILDDWREILFEKSPKEVFANITGKFSDKNKSLTCYGLVFGINIDIFHAKVDLKKLVDQEKILGVSNQFHLSSNRSTSFNIRNRTITYEFDLDTRVAFWDRTSQKSRRLLDPPSLNIKLPSDFFYPFVKMGNSGLIVVSKFSLVFFCLCLNIVGLVQ